VTVGPGASRREGELFDAGDFAEYLYLHGIAVELAEATAEWAHRRIREAWGIADEDARDREEVLRKGYRGCRYSFGYPACPALEDQRVLLRLLGADRLGVTLTEQLQMVPEQSTSAIVFHHPAARYFIA
jgi:5-methyltetrahydrofolate--homocysteine methyltransferase